jgi:hypothetical protein
MPTALRHPPAVGLVAPPGRTTRPLAPAANVVHPGASPGVEPTGSEGVRADMLCTSRSPAESRPKRPQGQSSMHSPAGVTPCDCTPGGMRVTIDPSTDWQSVIGVGAHAAPAATPPPQCDACPCCNDVCDRVECSVCGHERALRGADSTARGKGRASYSRCEIRRHCTQQSCWLVSHGKIYDVTSAVRTHPGGARAILRHAGQEASEDFEFHSAAAKKLWKPLLIGSVEPCVAHPEKTDGSCTIS